MRLVSAVGTIRRAVVLRIQPGEDLLEGIEAGCARYGIKYGIITSCIGSLERIYLNYYFAPKDDSSDPFGKERDLDLREPCVLISGQGLICENADGSGLDVHLHAVMRDNYGKVYGSHIPKGNNIVQYTVDVCVEEVGGMRLLREWEEETQHLQTKPVQM